MEERVCAFIDILGFKQIMERIHDKNDPLGADFIEKVFDAVNEIIKPISKKEYIDITGRDDINDSKIFDQIITKSVFSDCIVVSSPTNGDIYRAFKNIAMTCVSIQVLLFMEYGVLLRGAITFGNLRHDDEYLYGEPLIRAYELEESTVIYPRIILEKNLISIIESYIIKYPIEFFGQDKDGLWKINQKQYIEWVIKSETFKKALKKHTHTGSIIFSIFHDHFKSQSFDLKKISHQKAHAKWAWLHNELFDEPLQAVPHGSPIGGVGWGLEQ